MKKIILSITGMLLVSIGFAQNLKLTGDFKIKDIVKKVYLEYKIGSNKFIDSADVKNGSFTIKNKLSEPTLANFYVKFQKRGEQINPNVVERLVFFIEPGTVKLEIKDTITNLKVTGSKSNIEYMDFAKQETDFNKALGQLYGQYTALAKAKDTVAMKKVDAEINDFDNKRNENLYAKYLKAHPSTPLAFYMLGKMSSYSLDPVLIEPLFNGLSEELKSSNSGIAFEKRIATSKNLTIGAMAMNFTQNDTLGKPVSLSDFRGKYVLLDFWASWCGPCRAENPIVVKAFNNYKDKGFTVLSVSLDRPDFKQAWLDAIHKDGLTWTHVSDLQFWDNAVAKLYGVNAVPQNYLIDPSGKIIAKDLRGEDLEAKLKEVIK